MLRRSEGCSVAVKNQFLNKGCGGRLCTEHLVKDSEHGLGLGKSSFHMTGSQFKCGPDRSHVTWRRAGSDARCWTRSSGYEAPEL